MAPPTSFATRQARVKVVCRLRMFSTRVNLICCLLIFFLWTPQSFADDILGCGGFVKSHANIDFSKVHIKLYTKAGSLKDQTECAPNNGYYFLPLYDRGEYVLKVEPPRGWSFEPTEVSLNVDGSTDLCSLGKDINFVFKGFGITGRVTSHGSATGPKGVTVSLFTDSDQENAVSTTTTAEGGTFYFTPIQPQKYVLVASHPRWIIEKSRVEATVREGNTELPDNSLVVAGFDVSGRVSSEDEPMKGVSFVLFGNGVAKNCETSPIKGFENRSPLCHVLSDKTGHFSFPSLSPGAYNLVPVYAGGQTKFDVQPTELSFKVNHDSLILPQAFIVTGFTISGAVYASKDVGLPGATIYLNKKEVAISDESGNYRVDNVKAGQYTLRVEADDVRFEEKNVKISPNSPELPSMSPSSYKVCGTVTLSAKDTLHHRKVVVEKPGSTFRDEIATNPQTGEYCLYLAPGKYQLSVIVGDEERSKGLQFYPVEHTIEVSSTPIKNINFLQLKATLTGEVKCLKNTDCGQTAVTLRVLDGATVKTTRPQGSAFEFRNVLPGQYEVLVDTDFYCWKAASHKISVNSERAVIEPFEQTGFSITFISSHDTIVEFTEPKATDKTSLNLPKGSTRHCVSTPGNYNFVPKSCHVYPRSIYTWSTNSVAPVILSSTEHEHRGSIVSASALDGVKVQIQGFGNPIILGPLKYVSDGQQYRYDFKFYANTDNEYVITPLSDILLFNPSSIKVIGVNDCKDNVAVFNGEMGKIISGSVVPPLQGVRIQIFGKDKSAPVQTLVTQNDGAYRVGPLDGRIDYSATAEKDGYVITAASDGSGNFKAHKLAEVIVSVSDLADKAALQGVLLSLSGGQSYRKNSVTGEDGQMIFNSLSPGEYYLRPMMKEYRFDPPSKMINVAEGATVTVKLSGKRVAFSAYGTVTSLNGEPEQGLLVEAVGQTDCASYQEEATTEENGNFRIRGLQPTCIFAIRLKPGAEANAHIQRATPSSVAVQATEDVHGIRLIAFHPISRTDITVHVEASRPEFYRTLRVKLCQEDMPDSPIHVSKLENQHSSKLGFGYNAGFLVHFPPLQADNRKYFVQLESSMSPTLHKYKSLPIYFEANSSFKHIKLSFHSERKIDQSDVNQTSVVALPLIMLVALAFLNRDSLWSYLNGVVERWTKPAPISRSPVQTVPIDPRADDIIVEQIMNINKRKVKPRKL